MQRIWIRRSPALLFLFSCLLYGNPLSGLQSSQTVLEQQLFNGIYGNHAKMVQDALKRGASANARGFWPEGRYASLGSSIQRLSPMASRPTALILAVTLQETSIVHILLAGGADVNARTSSRGTALVEAARRGNSDIVKALLNRNAKVNETDADGYTPLIWAILRRKPNIVKVLLNKGADVNKHTKTTGLDALMIASARGYADTVPLLLRRGARTTAKDMEGRTALDLAQKFHRQNVVSILKQRHK